MFQLKTYPTPVAGLALGLLGICAFWAAALSGGFIANLILITGLILALFLLFPIFGKFVCHPHLLFADIKHPTIGSVVPTMAMALMLLSHTVGLLSQPLAIVIWTIAVIAHIIFFSIFCYHRLRDFDLNHIVPSWFVPPIGIVVACLTVPATFFLPLAYALLAFGLISYAVLLPIVLYRLTLGDKVEDARKPTLAILAAPASLTLAGYLTLVHSPNALLVVILFSVSTLMTVSVYLMMLHLLRLPFSPACSAFTFPLAIGATAMYKLSHWAVVVTLFNSDANFFHYLALTQGVIASVIISYVLLRTINIVYCRQV